MSSPSTPLDSAGIIVLRDDVSRTNCEVLLVQRRADSRAFGGAHVFPGGMVDADDAALGSDDDSRFRVAAVRELFEETGLLLACVASRPLTFDDPRLRARYAADRVMLLDGRIRFPDIVATGHLELATDALAYWSRWITPTHVARRYDARFFVARVPAGQRPLHDDRETIAIAWCTPAAALTAARSGTITLAPPTVRTLEDLAVLGSSERIFEEAIRRHVAPILPKPVVVEGRQALLCPGDADYEAARPGASVPERTSDVCNRMVMMDGWWTSVRSTRSK